MNVDQAVWCSDRLVAVIFGAVDYTRERCIRDRYEEIYQKAFSKLYASLLPTFETMDQLYK